MSNELPEWWPSDNPWIIGDFLDNEIPDNTVPLIFTSPPFKDEDVEGDYWETYDKWFKEMERICSDVICIIHSATKINELMRDYPPKHLMIWGKGVSKYPYRFNPILIYQLSDYNVNPHIWTDCIGVPSLMGKGKEHKYQDPVILYSTIIDMFKDLNPILDPFLGSGTTIKAGRMLKRPAMGFEIDPKYIELIEKTSLQNTPSLKSYI